MLNDHRNLRVRSPAFDFANSRKYWFNDSPIRTHALNVYTLLVPDNEKYYIRTLKSCVDSGLADIASSELHSFFMQESQHGIAHRKFWKHIGVSPEKISWLVRIYEIFLYRFLERFQPIGLRVSIVSAIEHINSVFAHIFLKWDLLDDCDPELKRLFYWHFAEEIEHKHIAFNVLQDYSSSYVLRVLGMLLAAPIFILLLALGTVFLLTVDSDVGFKRTFAELLELNPVGPESRYFVREVIRYLSPSFEPWDLMDYELANAHLAVVETT